MGKSIIFIEVILVLVVIAISFTQVLPVYQKYRNAERELYDLNTRYERTVNEYHSLLQEIHDLEHTPFAIEKVAREKFRMCREGEQIYIYTE